MSYANGLLHERRFSVMIVVGRNYLLSSRKARPSGSYAKEAKKGSVKVLKSLK